jgi:tRNA (guanine37-N1)-methyltransferase
MIDAISRNIPGVLGSQWAAGEDSHATGLLEYAQYTRPHIYRGLEVPKPLLSGDHAAIERWRRLDAIRRTWEKRPDLLVAADLSDAERKAVKTFSDQADESRRQKDGKQDD